VVEQIVYSAMEDSRLDIIIGGGPAAQAIQIDLARYTRVASAPAEGVLKPRLDRKLDI
jgi:Holliday junction DNA helicase RuvB